MRRTLYEILMVSPGADQEVITIVYRHLAKRFHPDVDPSPQAQSRMAELNEAYEVLDHPEKRARYDELLAGGREPTSRSTREGTSWSEAAADGAAPGSSEPFGEAGPPPSSPEPAGAAMTFGRYRGWALNQVARFDRDYIEWLSRTPAGRTYRQELDALLRRTR
jgi:DnaJ-class molecular chaperone